MSVLLQDVSPKEQSRVAQLSSGDSNTQFGDSHTHPGISRMFGRDLKDLKFGSKKQKSTLTTTSAATILIQT